jgi:tRNA (guanine37-N1)-methyltransferase
MLIDVLTLFPEMFSGPFNASIIKRAVEKGLVEINIHNLRDWGIGKHRQVDGRPYGGGVGMILRVDVIVKAIEEIKKGNQEIRKSGNQVSQSPDKPSPITRLPDPLTVLLTPQGKLFNQKKAWTLSKLNRLILVCGHYEGFDERAKNFVDEEISIGNYVLTGGEIPAMVLTDSIVRLIPGVLEKPEALEQESFQPLTINHQSLNLEFPQYTRPVSFRSLNVPTILLSGDHQKIKKWREEQALKKTRKKRPDLINPNDPN